MIIDGTIVCADPGRNEATKQPIWPMNKGNWVVMYKTATNGTAANFSYICMYQFDFVRNRHPHLLVNWSQWMATNRSLVESPISKY